jgi:hypothetical protein
MRAMSLRLTHILRCGSERQINSSTYYTAILWTGLHGVPGRILINFVAAEKTSPTVVKIQL